jgi:voltage-gated potassium channel Kch
VDRTRRKALIIGDLEIAARTCAALRRHQVDVAHLAQPDDEEIRAILNDGVDAVAVLVRSDVIALRYALAIEHLRPSVPLIATVFDRTLADQLTRTVPGCQVTSPADIAVPSLVSACLDTETPTRKETDNAVPASAGFSNPYAFARPTRQSHLVLSHLRGRLRPTDRATKIMLAGLSGLVGILALDFVLSLTALHEPPLHALYAATQVIATVGPGADGHLPAWYLLFATMAMLLTIVLTAMFTAGAVEWLLSSRTMGLIGSRTMPSHNHVVVVGLGQVGLRLCSELKALGVPVVAVEKDPDAPNLRLARSLKIPVIIAHAEDRATLERLALKRARSLAAVSANPLENVQIAITTLAVAPHARVVIRAGGDDVINESRSLFRIGPVIDVAAQTSSSVTQTLLGHLARTGPDAQQHAANYPEAEHLAAADRCKCISLSTPIPG